jgi:hypothetical protein
MSELLDRYLFASEVRRITPSTFLRNQGIDFATHHAALIAELLEAERNGAVVEVASVGGGKAYVESLS